MAQYPIKMLRDQDNQVFLPFTTAASVVDENGVALQSLLNNQYAVINNLLTELPGQGVLDAAQGKVLADMIVIPEVNIIPCGDGIALQYTDGTYIYYQKIQDIRVETWPLEITLPSNPSFDNIYYIGLTPINITGTYTGLQCEYNYISQNKVKIYVNNDQLESGLNIIIIGHWHNGEIPSI